MSERRPRPAGYGHVDCPGDAPEIVAFIDPFDASLISIHYCNIPCVR